MTISFYPDTFSQNFTIVSPENVISGIIGGQWRNNIEYLRTLNKKEYDTEKKKLPALTWGGAFAPGTRSIATLKAYSSLVVIDVDKLDETMVATLKVQLAADPYVYFVFTSPSGAGIKIVVKVNSPGEHHRSAFLHLQNYFENTYLIKVDQSGKDVSRLCYVSYDPLAFVNTNSKVFEVDLKYGVIVSDYKTTEEGYKSAQEALKIFHVCVKWVERNKTYRDGERNVYLHALACAMNRCGVRQADTLALLSEHYETPDLKWHQSVKSAYFHNQHEHGKVQIREVARQDFIAPAYIADYSSDVAINELMHITSVLYSFKVPNNEIFNILHKLGTYYNKEGYIDLAKVDLITIMNTAIIKMTQNAAVNASKMALPYIVAEEMIMNILDHGTADNAVPIGLPIFDNEMGGGMLPGNLYGFIGMGESFKSWLAQYACLINAMNGIPSLYLNAEMSINQYYERLISMAFGFDLRAAISSGKVSKSNVEDFMRQLKEVTKNNIFVVNSSGFTKTGVLSTMETITANTGKKIKLLVSDGLTQYDWGGQQEIMATINNSMAAKDIAKEAYGGEGVAHAALIHVSGDIKRHYRDTGAYVRGGKKVLANTDAYFCMSRLIDPSTDDLVNEDDVKYIPGKFYLRYVDKRSKTGIVNGIVDVISDPTTQLLKLQTENCDPNLYERKIKKNQYG